MELTPGRQLVADAMAAAIARFDTVLVPWGFTFTPDEILGSHTGPYASGFYCRDTTRIGLSFRETIDNLIYEHTFVTSHISCRETERFSMGHDSLMRHLGHLTDCRVIPTLGCNRPATIAARDGGDIVDALIYDWTSFAQNVLRKPCDEFFAIIRRGYGSWDLE